MGLDIVWHLATSHFILVVLVVFFSAHVTHNIYGLVLVTDLQNDYVNSHDFVARLNTKLQIEMYGHFALVGVLLLFMELSWAAIMVAVTALVLYWIKKTSPNGRIDATTVFDLEVQKNLFRRFASLLAANIAVVIIGTIAYGVRFARYIAHPETLKYLQTSAPNGIVNPLALWTAGLGF